MPVKPSRVSTPHRRLFPRPGWRKRHPPSGDEGGRLRFGRSPPLAPYALPPRTCAYVARTTEALHPRATATFQGLICGDVWMMLALAAEHTQRIGSGPGVLVPALRHPMVNAAGAAALEALAPGRTAVAFGTGFTGARAMGARPSTWSYLTNYIGAFRRMLRGETVEWDGARMRMLHPAGHAAPRPVEVPVLISALGLKGLAVRVGRRSARAAARRAGGAAATGGGAAEPNAVGGWSCRRRVGADETLRPGPRPGRPGLTHPASGSAPRVPPRQGSAATCVCGPWLGRQVADGRVSVQSTISRRSANSHWPSCLTSSSR
jgi:alkanesulfonate monooxygenase SsuD/methylene tetrahydromethanopterin reductase-like flavin-dependent oxidoreductase (luciferase family)